MPNAWMVIWFENNQKFMKRNFPGESPRASGAIDYAKSIVARGIPVAQVHVVSMRKAFAPPPKIKQPPGTFWCPFCLKYREFRIYAVVTDGWEGPEILRCPVCHVSVSDYWIRKYNSLLVAKVEMAASMKTTRLPSVKTIKGRRR